MNMADNGLLLDLRFLHFIFRFYDILPPPGPLPGNLCMPHRFLMRELAGLFIVLLFCLPRKGSLFFTVFDDNAYVVIK